MATREGGGGRGARWYGDELAVLRGVLADEGAEVVYPDDYCPECVAEGVADAERCFHRHWDVDDGAASEALIYSTSNR